MEKMNVTESLKLIESVLELRKRKHEENGYFLLFWGVLVAIAGVLQYVIIAMGKPEKSGFVWLFTMLPGFVFSFIAGWRNAKKKVKQQKSPDTMGWVWAFTGSLAMLNGFFFGKYVGVGFTLMLFLPFYVLSMVVAMGIKNNLWVILTIIATIIGYSSIFVPFLYHSLVTSVIAIVLFAIPGANLYINHRKNKNV